MSALSTSNMFSVLGKRNTKNPTQQRQPRAKKPAGEEPVKGKGEARKPKAAPVVEDEGPKKPGAIVSLAAAAEAPPAAPKVVEEKAPSKADRAGSDRQDRSGKGHRERKGGEGKGGWTEDLRAGERDAAAAEDAEKQEEGEGEGEQAADAPKPKAKKAKDGEEKEKTPEESPKPEVPKISLEQWEAKQAEQRKKVHGDFKVRNADRSQFTAMTVHKKEADTFMALGRKEAPKPAPKVVVKEQEPAKGSGKKGKKGAAAAEPVVVEEPKPKTAPKAKGKKQSLEGFGFNMARDRTAPRPGAPQREREGQQPPRPQSPPVEATPPPPAPVVEGGEPTAADPKLWPALGQ